MSTLFFSLNINLESFGAKTQKLWQKNRLVCNVWYKIGQVFLAIIQKMNNYVFIGP